MRQNKSIQFVKLLKRASKAPFPTTSTSLLLANVVSNVGEELELDYSRYIYIHRDENGKTTGISISKSIVAEYSNTESQYLCGVEMYQLLLFYIDEIGKFCELWADEFEAVFLLPPDLFFEIAKWHWGRLVPRKS